MFNGIDHFVIVVPELEAAIRDYTEAGFTVVRGGRHNIGSHNALIGLADGAYIELIAFLDSVGGHPWYAALEKGGGLVDFCMQTDDLETDAQAMRQAGVPMSAANPMTRDRPDGFRVSWVLSIPGAPFNGRAPFLIKDETPRDERVPRQRSHRNGVTGLKAVTIAVTDPGASGVPPCPSSGRTSMARGHGLPSGRMRWSWSPRRAGRVPWSIGSSCAGNRLLASCCPATPAP